MPIPLDPKKKPELFPEDSDTYSSDVEVPTEPSEPTSVAEFLQRIAKNESSNKYYVDHPEMQGGIHKGMQAVGKYGLMPYTVAELMEKRARANMPEDLNLPVGENPDAAPGTPAYKSNALYIADQLRASPEGQEILAEQMAKELLEKTGGDQDRAAYMWTMGHNMPVSRVTPKKMDTSDYVKKFRKSAKQDTPDVPQLEEQSRSKKRQFKSLKRK